MVKVQPNCVPSAFQGWRLLFILQFVLSSLLSPGCAPADSDLSNSDKAPDSTNGSTFWRSSLYPEDWSPEFSDEQGRFLHDFSYAGYRNSNQPIPSATEEGIPGPKVVVEADPDGKNDSTAAIQAAIDEVAELGGGVVYFPEGLYRIDGLLSIQRSGVVLQGEGPERSRLWFTRVEGMSDKAHITFRGGLQNKGHLPLVEDGESRSREVLVEDAGELQEGDSVSLGWVITDDFVERHGMTGVWKSFNGRWQSFFRREIRAIDKSASPHRITLDLPLRYPALMKDQAAIQPESGYLEECGLVSLGLSNAVHPDAAWKELRVHAVDFIQSADCYVHDVRTFAPPLPEAGDFHLQNGGIRVLQSKRITLDSVHMENAQNRGEGGCGYLFEVSQSSEVLIRDSVGRKGRHNFIQNWGFGTSGLVLLRIHSSGGRSLSSQNGPSQTGFSEFHHSLAMANLIDSALLDDGFQAINRKHWSSGAGHTATESVFWNSRGEGHIESHQFQMGYVIGSSKGLLVNDSVFSPIYAKDAEPEDFLEGIGEGQRLEPSSLFEDQLRRRLNREK